MKHRVKAVDRVTGKVKFADIEADTPEVALRRVDQTKYDVAIVAASERPQGDDRAASRQGALNVALGPPQQKPARTRRPDEPLDDSVGGLPSWVATGSSLKSAHKTLIAFVLLLAGGIGLLVLAEMGNRGQLTAGHIIAFGVGFAVVALALIFWKLSAILRVMQGEQRGR